MLNTTAEEAVARIHDGARLMIGGFMGVGTPEGLIDELLRQGKRELTVIANDSALPGTGIGKLVTAGGAGGGGGGAIGVETPTQQKKRAGGRGRGGRPARGAAPGERGGGR